MYERAEELKTLVYLEIMASGDKEYIGKCFDLWMQLEAFLR